MNYIYVLSVIGIMAFMSYLPRVLPLTLFRKKITNKYVLSFLIYMPYGVLSAMIFPSILYSTSSIVSAIVGSIVAIITSFFNLGLLPTALISTFITFICELIMKINV